MNDKQCGTCGMPGMSWNSYHPYAACLMFRACQDSTVVEENLRAVIEYGRFKSNQAGPTAVNPPGSPGSLPSNGDMVCSECGRKWIGSPGGECPVCGSALKATALSAGTDNGK